MQEKCEAYNDDVSSLTAQVLIFYGGSRELSSSSRLMIVSKYNEAIDKKGNDTYQIFG